MGLSTINCMKVLRAGMKYLQQKINTMAEEGCSLTKTWIRLSTTLIFQHLMFLFVRSLLVEKAEGNSNIVIIFTRILKGTYTMRKKTTTIKKKSKIRSGLRCWGCLLRSIERWYFHKENIKNLWMGNFFRLLILKSQF